jgi:hypothetical protein
MQYLAHAMFYFKENELLLKIKAYLFAHEKKRKWLLCLWIIIPACVKLQ